MTNPTDSSKEIQELSEELWDKHAEYIDDGVSSLSDVAGTTVLTQSGFQKLIEDLAGHLHPSPIGWISADNPPDSEHDDLCGPFLINVAAAGQVDYVHVGEYYRGQWYWLENHKPLSKDFVVTHYAELPEPATGDK
jgi:hypothetical protein